MEIIVRIAYLIIPTALGLTICYWSSTFKRLSSMSREELNEGDEIEEDKVSSDEAERINQFGLIIFIIIGILIWLILGITIGRIASLFAPDNFSKWIIYIMMYLIFLRFPFGVCNKMIKRSFDFEKFPEKIIFSFIMILSYILSIYNYELIPEILKWHLNYVN